MKKIWETPKAIIGIGTIKPPQFAFTLELRGDDKEWEFAICILFLFAFINWGLRNERNKV